MEQAISFQKTTSGKMINLFSDRSIISHNIHLYLYIFFTINWGWISYYTKIDGAYRIPFFLGLLLFFQSYGFFINSFPCKIWFCWIIYAFVNSFYSKYALDYEHYILLILPFFILVVSCRLATEENSFVYPFIVFCIITLVLFSSLRVHILKDFSFFERTDSSLGVNANELGLYSAFLSVLIVPFILMGEKKRIIPFLLLIAICFSIIFRTGSRSALILATVGILLFIVLSSRKKHVLRLVFIATVFYYIVNPPAFLSDTLLWQRLENTQEDAKRMYYADSFIAKYAGDRASYYYGGTDIFREHPWNGVGFNNYIYYNPFGDFVCHVEVMSQLSEEGLCGAILFYLFYLFIGCELLKARKSDNSIEWSIVFSIFIVICISNFMSYTTKKIYIYLLLGYVLGYINSHRNSNKKNLSESNEVLLNNP